MIRSVGGEGLTLGGFAALYVQRRSQSARTTGWRKSQKPIKEATLRIHRMALRYLIAWFGESRQVESLSPMEIEDWLDALASGKLNHVRQWNREQGKPPSEQKIRSLIRALHAAFQWGVNNEVLTSNPMADFSGTSQPPEKPNHYVTLGELDALCRSSRSPDVATLSRLCRLAGLRRGEALSVRWIDVDWHAHRLKVHSPKTGKRRQVPLSPDLYAHLLDRFTYAHDGRNRIVQLTSDNVLRKVKAAMRRANVGWPKPFQSMRSSCENDWKERGIAEATYLAWMGHSQTVSREFYVTPTDWEFSVVTGV